MQNTRIAIIGAGRIGSAVRELLRKSFVQSVGIFDTDPKKSNGSVRLLDDPEKQLNDYDIWVVATPYTENKKYIDLAAKLNKIYIDFTEDVEVSQYAKTVAANGSGKFIPQCGLAPGLVNIIANGLAKKFERVESINIRVGALPNAAMNESKYAITWSPEGVVNEYLNRCKCIEHGKIVERNGMTGYETLVIDGKEYEAFRTSGGIGTMVDEWGGAAIGEWSSSGIETLEYKTIRYVGHHKWFSQLADIERMFDRKTLVHTLKDLVPETRQDKVIVYIEVAGFNGDKYEVKNFVHEFLPILHMTAIEISTALGALVWIFYASKYPETFKTQFGGFVKQEDMDFAFFTENINAFLELIYKKRLTF